jgi:hypothetical protein
MFLPLLLDLNQFLYFRNSVFQYARIIQKLGFPAKFKVNFFAKNYQILACTLFLCQQWAE